LLSYKKIRNKNNVRFFADSTIITNFAPQ